VRTDDRLAAAAAGRSRLKASDSDRDRVLDMLKAAFAQGRLTKDEFDERVGQTLVSRTWGDLIALTDDIPAWPIPRPVRKPARQPSSEPAPALIKAVACAIIAMSAVAVAGMPGMWTMPAPPSLTAQACQNFDGWQSSAAHDPLMLNEAVAVARNGSSPDLARDLATLQQAFQRSEQQPQSAAAAQHNQRMINSDAYQVSRDCVGS
jgi:Domain of unknown function (DUF1707)